MKRRIAVVGDSLSTGGLVLEDGGLPVKFMGHQVALIGGHAFCAACKSPGIIAKSGGSYRSGIMGKETALDGDIVLCGCPVHPRIVATLGGESWAEDDLDGSGKQVASALTAAGGVASITKGAFDERVKATGHVTEGMPYYIETGNITARIGNRRSRDAPG